MKIILSLLLCSCLVAFTSQPKRTSDQTDRLNAKNGFRTYVLGTPLSYYINKIEKRVEDARVHSRLYKFKNEDLNISSVIKAEWILFEFNADKLDEISVKIKSGSQNMYDFLFREYGDPDVRPTDVDNPVQLYMWKGRQAHVQLYYTNGKEGAIFKISSPELKTEDSDIRKGF